jgi:hypothetical protein
LRWRQGGWFPQSPGLGLAPWLRRSMATRLWKPGRKPQGSAVPFGTTDGTRDDSHPRQMGALVEVTARFSGAGLCSWTEAQPSDPRPAAHSVFAGLSATVPSAGRKGRVLRGGCGRPECWAEGMHGLHPLRPGGLVRTVGLIQGERLDFDSREIDVFAMDWIARRQPMSAQAAFCTAPIPLGRW